MWVGLVDDDVVVSFAQSDLDAIGAYGGGVRVGTRDENTVAEFLTTLPEYLLCKWNMFD